MAVVLSALAVGALAASSAQAEWEWQLEGQQLSGLAESEAISGTGGTFTLATSILGSKATVTCESMALTSSKVTPEGKGVSTLSLSQCHMVEPAGCTVTEPISLKSNTEVFTATTSSKLFNRYTPTETKFGTLKITACALEGAYGIAGSIAGEFEAGEERVKEPITFSPKNSEEGETKLTVGGNAATLEGKFEIAAAGPFAEQKMAAAPLASNPAGLFFPNTKMGKPAEPLTTTHTVKGKKNVKFKAATIVGGAGVFTVEKDTCSGKEKKPGETCAITVAFTPTAVQNYKALLLTPWETSDGLLFGVRSQMLEGNGVN